MITISRKYELIVKTNLSAYAIANAKELVPSAKILGSTMGAVNKMLSLSQELKLLMPEIIGLAAVSPDWDRMIARYWNSLSEPIPYVGKTLETGFKYDLNDVTKKEYINAINTQIKEEDKKIKTDEDLKTYIYLKLSEVEDAYKAAILEANSLSEKDKETALKAAYDAKYAKIWNIEAEHYKVGTPIEPFQYLLWKYCLVCSHVANEFSFAEKSMNIEFYLSSEDNKKQLERIKIQTKNKAMEKYLSIITSKKNVADILFAIGLGGKIFDLAKDNEGADLDLQLHVLLQSTMDKDPAKFISLASDKNIALKGLIEKYVTYNIFKRIQGTNIITDYTNPSKIIGNDLDAAVTFCSNPENVAVVSEYETRFKDLNSKFS